MTLFSTLPLSPKILQVVGELGFDSLTPIQAQAIPVLLEGKDLIGQSKTGSGKTAAFTLPILERINIAAVPRRLQAVVLCPTRELCTQVAREMRKLGRRHPGLQVLILAGGQPIFSQLGALEKGIHIAVGTPGRVLDHLNRKTLNLREVQTVVLDEADRMLDMGFQEDMEMILREVSPTRQTVFFSATYPRSIETMSRSYQRDPVRVTIDEEERELNHIRQQVMEVSQEDKTKALLAVLQQMQPESALVFCNQKATVTQVTKTLLEAQVSVACLHGDLEQFERDRVMARFKNRSVRILIATDVAARGIDVEDLDLVVNYDIPVKPEIYVHRIGRTGRAGKKGLAVTFAMAREKFKLKTIEEFANITFERMAAKLEQEHRVKMADAEMATLFISGGRKDKMRPGDILGALTGEAGGLKGEDIGKIEIHDNFSYVAVAKYIAETAMQRLNDGKIKGKRFRVHVVK